MRREAVLGIWAAPSAGQGAGHFLWKPLVLKVELLRPGCQPAWEPVMVTTWFFLACSSTLQCSSLLHPRVCQVLHSSGTSVLLWGLVPYVKSQSYSRKATKIFWLQSLECFAFWSTPHLPLCRVGTAVALYFSAITCKDKWPVSLLGCNLKSICLEVITGNGLPL